MPDKKIKWWEPQIGEKEKQLINQAIDDNYINEGNLTHEFENKIAELLEAKHAIATTSGTVAIFLALKALGIGHDDEVIVPDITFVATANAVDLCGATPVLIDVDEDTMNISAEAFEKAITGQTKAVIPVHYTGHAADMEKIMRIAGQNNIAVIEDAAEALLSKYKEKYLGTIGNVGCFSFSPNKTITTGQGGMVITDNDDLAAKLRGLKNQGRPSEGGDIYNSIGYNFRLTNLQAAIGLGQLEYLFDRTERMKQIHQIYSENLQNIKQITLNKFNIAGGEVPQWTDALTDKRDELIKYLDSANIQCRAFWLPIHQQKPYKMADNNFPNSTKLHSKSFWLPSCFSMTDEDVLRVCEEIKKFYLKE